MTTPKSALLSCAQMGAADSATIASGTPGFTLMQRAGTGAAALIRRRYRPAAVLVACGPGNNGGDGFIIADDLRRHGWPVTVALLGEPSALTGDAALAFEAWSGSIVPFERVELSGQSLFVDAIFGAGLTRPISGVVADVLQKAWEKVHSGALTSVAVDMPSGVHGDTGLIWGCAVPADMTVTFHRRKPGHVLRPGRDLCGDVRVIDIGLETGAVENLSNAYSADVITSSIWPTELVAPKPSDHKYTRGHVAIMAGSMTGAARLAAAAARAVGAGLVTVLCRPGSENTISADAPGLIVTPWDEAEDLKQWVKARKVKALVIGPGLGLDETARELGMAALGGGCPLVADADLLTQFEGRWSPLRDALPTGSVLTPHEGEFKRLFPDLPLTELGRLAAAQEAADRMGATVLLKGPDTVVAAPSSRANRPRVLDGAPATLAMGGTGDVLAGLIAALLARGVSSPIAAAAAAWKHANAAERLTETSMFTPEDLCSMISII